MKRQAEVRVQGLERNVGRNRIQGSRRQSGQKVKGKASIRIHGTHAIQTEDTGPRVMRLPLGRQQRRHRHMGEGTQIDVLAAEQEAEVWGKRRMRRSNIPEDSYQRRGSALTADPRTR